MLELALKLGLFESEYRKICEILHREPNRTELGIFSVMWSEHCSYKSSFVHLKRFPRKSLRAVFEMGAENAGVIRLRDNWAVVFKIESHNHPSAIEPFQGAATGVGGILRDIFTMGAYPVAALNSLRFGELDSPVTKHLFDGVVRGIAFYGNCFGVPTVGGEVYFENAYAGNPLVNAMAVGIVDTHKMISARAKGLGNPVVYIGSATGRDGIHGASFASGDLTEKSQQDRPSVQIGDPFTEKLVLEATQEIAAQKLAVAMQDMGAAGLTSSSSEMAAKGGVGIEMNLDNVPVREADMTPYDLMLSESQERMLLIATHENLPAIEKILQKWGLHYAVIGKVIEQRVLRLLWKGKVAAEIPVHALNSGDGAPLYDLPAERPAFLDKINARDAYGELFKSLESIKPKIFDVLTELLSMPSIASKRWVYSQYDHQVGARTVHKPGSSDAAVIRVPQTGQFIALATDCNGAFCYLDPHIGSALAVLESAANVVATGAEPAGITDCLNFGNPNKPAVMWQFSQSVNGISEVCKAWGIPVTGGNVSFYNESPSGAVFPTPVIGMLGIIEDANHITPMAFQCAGDEIIVLGGTYIGEVGGSQLQKAYCGDYFGVPPASAVFRHVATQKFLLAQIRAGIVSSAHDVSEGGIGIALAECVMASNELGCEVNLPIDGDTETALWLFCESAGRFIVTITSSYSQKFCAAARAADIPFTKLGVVSASASFAIGTQKINASRLRSIFENVIPSKMKT